MKENLKPYSKVRRIVVHCSIFLVAIIIGYLINGWIYDYKAAKSYNPKTKSNHPIDVNISTSTRELHSSSECQDQEVGTLKIQLNQFKKKALALMEQTQDQEKIIARLYAIINDDINTMNRETEVSISRFIRQKIDEMEIDDQDVLSLIQNYINIDADDIPVEMTVKDFAVKLTEVLAKDILEPSSIESNTEDTDSNSIQFGTSTLEDNSAQEAKRIFSPDETKIFATFDTSQNADDEVLVKWFQIDQPEVFLFKKFPVNPDSDYSYIWFEQPTEWAKGKYSVEIYSLKDNLKMLAMDQYEIR